MSIKQLARAGALPLLVCLTLIVSTLSLMAEAGPAAQEPTPRITNTPRGTPPPTNTSTRTPTATKPTKTRTPTGPPEPTETATLTETPAPTDTERPLFPITPITTPTFTPTVSIVTPIPPQATVPPASPTATRTATPTLTPTSTLTPTATQTLTPTATSTLTPTATSTLTPTATSTLTPTATATPTPTPTPTLITSIPVVTITSPVSGTQGQVGQPVTVEVVATDPTGVTQVELWVDGKLTNVQSRPAEGAQPSWNTRFIWTPQSPGSHTLGARATNSSGQKSALVSIIINVIGGVARLTITNPANGAQVEVGQEVTVQAEAEDSLGVVSAELWVNGALAGTWAAPASQGVHGLLKVVFIQATQVNITFPWTPQAAGSYTLEVRSFRPGGQQSARDSVSVQAVAPALPTPSTLSPTGGTLSLWWVPALLLASMLVLVRAARFLG
jgi:hypothetical protein